MKTLVRSVGLFPLTLACLLGCQSTVKVHNESSGTAGIPSLSQVSPLTSEFDKYDVELAVGETWERQGKLEDACDLYRRIAAKTNSAVAYHRAAILSDQLGKAAQARELFSQALAIDPRNSVILTDLGYSYYLSNELTQAEKVLRQAIDLNPDYERAHVNLGFVLGSQRLPDDAMEAFTRGGCSPGESLNNLALVAMHAEDWVEATRLASLASRYKTQGNRPSSTSDVKLASAQESFDEQPVVVAAKQWGDTR